MDAQSELNKVMSSVTGGIGIAIKAGQSIGGMDQKMADKARKTAQQKINAIYANKELYNKAKTRRLGQVMDDYNKTIGGSK